MRRCPAVHARGTDSFIQAYMALQAGHGWPAQGAMLDQAAWFVQAVEIADAERGRIEAALAPRPDGGGS